MANIRTFIPSKRRHLLLDFFLFSILKIIMAGTPIMGLEELREFYVPGAVTQLYKITRAELFAEACTSLMRLHSSVLTLPKSNTCIMPSQTSSHSNLKTTLHDRQGEGHYSHSRDECKTWVSYLTFRTHSCSF